MSPENANLAKTHSGVIAKPKGTLSVGMLEHELLDRYPRSDAEEWDRMGTLVGDPAEPVSGVLVALDPTIAAIEAAQSTGANVVLTHHPAFLEPPAIFAPQGRGVEVSGSVVWEAIRRGIALMNIHTALDVSSDAFLVLPTLLSLEPLHVLFPLEGSKDKGYGQVCAIRDDDEPLKLGQLAARCLSVFGCDPRVWGPDNQVIRKVAIMNGSVGSSTKDLIEICHEQSIDCVICGEIRYHGALDMSQEDIAIIELGHDVSEFPLTAVLAKATVDAGIPASDVSIFEQAPNWTTPEATRV